MSVEHNPEEEYRLITDHIFHEVKLQLDRNKFFVGINFTLFAALGYFIKDIFGNSSVISINSDIGRFSVVIPILGLFISMFWVGINRKVESHLYLRVIRANELEKLLSYKIYISNTMSRSRRIQGPAGWIIYESIGYLFALIWLTLFAILLKNSFSLVSWPLAVSWSLLLLAFYVIVEILLGILSKKRMVK